MRPLAFQGLIQCERRKLRVYEDQLPRGIHWHITFTGQANMPRAEIPRTLYILVDIADALKCSR
jgi:hypothetical protein